jgi:hypothetical protein
LGNGIIDGTWNHAGDVLMLEVTNSSNASNLQITPQQTRFQFLPNFKSPLRTLGIESYPCLDLSPVVQGEFNSSYCAEGMIFNKHYARCEVCGFGNYRSVDGLTCHPCPSGTFAPTPTSSDCTLCEPGSFMSGGEENRSQCVLASAGKYVVRAGASYQVSCPDGMYAEGLGHAFCLRCPQGAACINDRTFARPDPGYFRTSTGTIVQCFISPACNGGIAWEWDQPATHCAAGMGGTLCQGCM